MDDSEVDEDSGEFTSSESSEKNDEGSDDPEYNPKFLHWNSSKSCKYWKQLQKAYVPIVQNHIEDFVSTL